MEPKTLVILYEARHIDRLDSLSDVEVLSLDAEIDYYFEKHKARLEKKGISFTSARSFQNRDEASAFLKADELTRAVCDNESLGFLKYKDISLIDPVRFSIQLYFVWFLTFVDIFANYFNTKEHRFIDVPPPATPIYESTSGFFAVDEGYAVMHAAWAVARSKGISRNNFSVPKKAWWQKGWEKGIFLAKRGAFGLYLLASNLRSQSEGRRPITILASDYWRNISPVLKKIPEAEVFLLDRMEALKAGRQNIGVHKMQFVHIDQYHVRSIRKDIDRQSKLLKTAWGKIRPTENGGVWGDVDFTFKGVNLRDPFVWDGHKGKGGVLVKLFDKHLIGGSLMLQIADTYEMLNRIKPNIVWVRASVSLQTHFSVLSLVARKLKIPSIEAQHGIEYLGPASATTRHAAENIAVYGNLVRDEYVSRGYSIEHLLVAGSPRFDSYANVVPQKIEPRTDFRILTTIPGINVSERFGSFSVEEHFKALGDALKVVPQAHLEVTSRSVDREAFMHEAMRRGLGKETKYEFAGNDPLPKLFEKADVFVCSFSTVVYEALLHGKPTVIVAFAPLERMMADFHFSKFEQAGALYIARTPEELKNALIQLADPETRARVGASGWDFMQKNFSFDGKASERIAEFIRTQAKAGGAS